MLLQGCQIAVITEAEDQLAGKIGTACKILMAESGHPGLVRHRIAVGFQPVVVALGRQAGDDQPPVLGRQWCEGDPAVTLGNIKSCERWRLQDQSEQILRYRNLALVVEAQFQHSLLRRILVTQAFDTAEALDQGNELTADGLVALFTEIAQFNGRRQ